MLAARVANECNASFLAIGISEILSMWQGESERNLALMFEKARSQKPCVDVLRRARRARPSRAPRRARMQPQDRQRVSARSSTVSTTRTTRC
jgi:SpoVK/Ycf46/Vps4 family AAA+-type ATPase